MYVVSILLTCCQLTRLGDPSVRHICAAWQLASVGIVNIRRDDDDNFYCYGLSLLNRIERKDNDMKMIVLNMFFHCELSARTTPKEHS
ncbi:hypothetical protein DFJ58DRAFT_655345 [Suillus subalutaceus]|uniref:uncharacterized protein n=1 Tax=Suillus subalutaceus TaxID=48586 RepID=UPI001B864806|nr:uncharacterized protein DFJ58DRAFT_655345 [Suillus subalutaceus]KAG1865443.1 hypothetical protein DFJ58DRAFT_655345 [Suillus subalutaceus]